MANHPLLAVQAGAGATGSGVGPMSAPLPPDVIAGDLLMYFLVVENPTGTVGNPTGYGVPQWADDTLGGAGIRIWAKLAGASEAAPSVTYSASPGGWAAVVVRVRGGAMPTLFAAQAQTSTSAPATPSIDPTADCALKFGVIYSDPISGVSPMQWETATMPVVSVSAGTNGINGDLAIGAKREETAGPVVGAQNWFTMGTVAFAVAMPAVTDLSLAGCNTLGCAADDVRPLIKYAVPIPGVDCTVVPTTYAAEMTVGTAIMLGIGGTYVYEVAGTPGGGVSSMKQGMEFSLGFGGKYALSAPVPVLSSITRKGLTAFSLDFKSSFYEYEAEPVVIVGGDPNIPPPTYDTPPDADADVDPPDPPDHPAEVQGQAISVSFNENANDTPEWTVIGR